VFLEPVADALRSLVARWARGRGPFTTAEASAWVGVDVEEELRDLERREKLVRGELRPGERMASMMAPLLACADDRPLLAAGAAGGTRLRTALLGTIAGILDLGLAPADAVARPRFHATATVVNAEPGVDEDALGILEQQGWRVRRWPALHHYFGGVSLVSRWGAAADPRRDGAAATVS
jgi:gamma-glutamyltranspeptidase/glutathione hydrolase